MFHSWGLTENWLLVSTEMPPRSLLRDCIWGSASSAGTGQRTGPAPAGTAAAPQQHLRGPG